jgi:hypothetical protein
MKKSLTILLAFCVFSLNAQKVFFSANNNETNRVVQSQAPPLITAGLIQNLDANLTNSYNGSGNIWTDIVGGNNGTIVGGTFTTSGGVSFFNFPTASVASYVSAPVTKSTSMTFNIWAKSNTVPVPNAMLFNVGNSGSGPDFFFAGTGFYWNIWDSYNTPYNDINNVVLNHTTIVTNTNWHNYTVTVDVTNSNTKFYFDGVWMGTSAYRSPANNNSLYLGGAGAGDNSWNFLGGISCFHTYNRALSAAEVSSNFKALKARYGL